MLVVCRLALLACLVLLLGGCAFSVADRAPLWSSVTVEADSATLADALSTAACHMDRAALAGLLDRTPDLRAVTLVDADGTVATLRRG